MWFLKKLFKSREDAAKAYAETHPQTDENGDVVKPFLDHLEDLRWMFIKSISTLCTAMMLAFFFRKSLVHITQWPLSWAGIPPESLRTDGPIDPITISLSMSFYAGIVVSFPLLFWFLAEFVLPALTRKEKKYILPGIAVTFVLFLGGVLLSFRYITPATLHWLYNDAKDMNLYNLWTVRTYLSFVTHICIAIGLICELPVLLVTLNAMGLVTAKFLRSMRIYGYAISLILAGIVSPTPDPVMLLLFAAPIMILFESCIWLIYWLEKRRERKEALERQDPNEPID
jgi:sec-independent protein translocase protein TatC